jgi:hypothetical protein
MSREPVLLAQIVRLAECVLVLAPVGGIAGGRLGASRRSPALGAMAGCALAAALSATLFRGGGRSGVLARLRWCAVTEPHMLSPDGLVNVALLAPAAFLAVMAIGRPLRVAAGLAAVSLTIEASQAIRAVGVCDSSDALLNGLGALAAALAAAGIRSAVAAVRPAAEPSVSGSVPCRRSC